MEAKLQVERVFATDSTIKLEDIVNSILDEQIDNLIEKYYNPSKVNLVTSSKKEDVQ